MEFGLVEEVCLLLVLSGYLADTLANGQPPALVILEWLTSLALLKLALLLLKKLANCLAAAKDAPDFADVLVDLLECVHALSQYLVIFGLQVFRFVLKLHALQRALLKRIHGAFLLVVVNRVAHLALQVVSIGQSLSSHRLIDLEGHPLGHFPITEG